MIMMIIMDDDGMTMMMASQNQHHHQMKRALLMEMCQNYRDRMSVVKRLLVQMQERFQQQQHHQLQTDQFGFIRERLEHFDGTIRTVECNAQRWQTQLYSLGLQQQQYQPAVSEVEARLPSLFDGDQGFYPQINQNGGGDSASNGGNDPWSELDLIYSDIAQHHYEDDDYTSSTVTLSVPYEMAAETQTLPAAVVYPEPEPVITYTNMDPVFGEQPTNDILGQAVTEFVMATDGAGDGDGGCLFDSGGEHFDHGLEFCLDYHHRHHQDDGDSFNIRPQSAGQFMSVNSETMLVGSVMAAPEPFQLEHFC